MISNTIYSITILVCLFCCVNCATFEQEFCRITPHLCKKEEAIEPRAFPEAVGFGSFSKGGRGEKDSDGHYNTQIVWVTNTQDYDRRQGDLPIPGSLRYAMDEMSGPRFVLFNTSGTIELKQRIYIYGEEDSYVTIAGQTSPGGIQLKNWGIIIGKGAHNIVIRHLRIRPGYTNDNEWDKDCVLIWAPQKSDGTWYESHNIIIDHCSLEWGLDENFDIVSNVRNVTVQNCLIAEGSLFGHTKGSHSMAFLAHGKPASEEYLTVYNCLLMNCTGRNPQINTVGGITDFVNNYIYNWGSYAFTIYHDNPDLPSPKVNITGNYFGRGKNYKRSPNRRPIDVMPAVNNESIYVENNCGNFPNIDWMANDWALVGNRLSITPDGSSATNLDESKRRVNPWEIDSKYQIGAIGAIDSARLILKNVGSNLPERDAVDKRLISEASTGEGTVGFGDSPETAEPHPQMFIALSPVDTDQDEMPDSWESEHGLDPTNPNDFKNDDDGDGYLNLEEYLNSMHY